MLIVCFCRMSLSKTGLPLLGAMRNRIDEKARIAGKPRLDRQALLLHWPPSGSSSVSFQAQARHPHPARHLFIAETQPQMRMFFRRNSSLCGAKSTTSGRPFGPQCPAASVWRQADRPKMQDLMDRHQIEALAFNRQGIDIALTDLRTNGRKIEDWRVPRQACRG